MEDFEYSDCLCCPYCKNEFEHTGDPLDQDEEIENECEHCGKTFTSVANYTLYFSNYKKKDDALHEKPEVKG